MRDPTQYLRTDRKPRCPKCQKPVAYMATRPWVIKCSRCRIVVYSRDHTEAGTLASTA